MVFGGFLCRPRSATTFYRLCSCPPWRASLKHFNSEIVTMTDIETRLEYSFDSPELLSKALTHRSYLNQSRVEGDNERLEFLGDSVISLVVCDYLYGKFEELQEDSLSKLKSSIVSQKNLSSWARAVDLGASVRLSDSERSSGGAEKDSIIAGCFESVIGAVFIDGGFEAARAIVRKFLDSQRLEDLENDSKSGLQEIAQARFATLPAYRIVKEDGPAHEKIFEVEADIKGTVYGRGSGRSKKEAQKSAAEDALKNLKDRPEE